MELGGALRVVGRVDGFVQHELDGRGVLLHQLRRAVKVPPGQALLHRVDVQLLKRGQDLQRRLHVVALIGVHAQTDVFAHSLTDEGQGAQVILRVDADLDLEDAEALLKDKALGRGLHLLRRIDADGDVVVYDRVRAAQELVDRQVLLLAHDVVERYVEGTLGRAVAVDDAVHQLVRAGDVHGVKADERLGEHLHDDIAGLHRLTGDKADGRGRTQAVDALVRRDLDRPAVGVLDHTEGDAEGFGQRRGKFFNFDIRDFHCRIPP